MATVSSIAGSTNAVKHVQLNRARTLNGNWLIEIPHHMVEALNKSTSGNIGYGTSFDHGASVCLYMFDGGTQLDGTGTAYGIFIGTGAV